MARRKLLAAPRLPTRLQNAKKRTSDSGQSHSQSYVPSASQIADDGITQAEERRLVDILRELGRRNMEALRHYIPLHKADLFHRSTAKRRVLYGSNQSGKSQAAAADVAMIAQGVHPWRTDTPKSDGLMYCVGFKEKHISEMMWPRLAKEGAIRLIRDEHTGEWRNWNPTQPYDRAYSEKARPAAPFIPERSIKTISWAKASEDLPSEVVLKNGWRIVFFSSKAEPQKGTQIHFFWIDEDIERYVWPAELMARSLRYNAPGIWSATPECMAPALYEWHLAAIHPQTRESVSSTHMHIDDNPYIPVESKQRFYDSLPRDLREIKYHGKWAIKNQFVFSEFSRDVHCIEGFQIPDNWTRYMVVDPGVSPLAVLFAAVPPDLDEVHLYDEIYAQNGSAALFAELCSAKMGDYKQSFEAFVIDNRMGRQRDVGFGKSVRQQYAEALKERCISSVMTGSDFLEGSTDTAGREEALRAWMSPSVKTGSIKLKIHYPRVQMLPWEIESQLYAKKDGIVDHSRRQRQNNHLVDCAEYLAALDPYYSPPPEPIKPEPSILKYLRDIEARHRRTGARVGAVSLGPPT